MESTTGTSRWRESLWFVCLTATVVGSFLFISLDKPQQSCYTSCMVKQRETKMVTKRTVCRHCKRYIKLVGDVWIDPEATGDDSVWRETCDEHDTFTANHEPVTGDQP